MRPSSIYQCNSTATSEVGILLPLVHYANSSNALYVQNASTFSHFVLTSAIVFIPILQMKEAESKSKKGSKMHRGIHPHGKLWPKLRLFTNPLLSSSTVIPPNVYRFMRLRNKPASDFSDSYIQESTLPFSTFKDYVEY